MIPLVAGIVSFTLGVYGVLAKRDIIRIFFGVTLMLSGISLLLITLGTVSSYVLVVFIWTVEIVEVIVTIALFLYLARKNVHDLSGLWRFKW